MVQVFRSCQSPGDPPGIALPPSKQTSTLNREIRFYCTVTITSNGKSFSVSIGKLFSGADNSGTSETLLLENVQQSRGGFSVELHRNGKNCTSG
jgi:hypothetical protein